MYIQHVFTGKRSGHCQVAIDRDTIFIAGGQAQSGSSLDLNTGIVI